MINKFFINSTLILILCSISNGVLAFSSDSSDPNTATLSILYKGKIGFGRLSDAETFKRYYGVLSYGNTKGKITLVEWDLDGDGQYEQTNTGSEKFEFVFDNPGITTASVNVYYSSGATEEIEIPNIDVEQGLDASILDLEESELSSIDLNDDELTSFYLQVNPHFSGKYKLLSDKKLKKFIKCGKKKEIFDSGARKYVDRYTCKISSRKRSRLISLVEQKSQNTFFYLIKTKLFKNDIPLKFTFD